MTSEQACSFLNVKARTLRDWQASGRVPFIRLPNGRPRFCPDALERWLAAGCPPTVEVRPRRRGAC